MEELGLDKAWLDFRDGVRPGRLTPIQEFFGDLVPYNCTFKSLKHVLTEDSWEVLRRWVYRRSHLICDLCGGVGDLWPTQANAVWCFDDANLYQHLVRVESLCPDCYNAKHLDIALYRAKSDEEAAQVFLPLLHRIQMLTGASDHEVRDTFEAARQTKTQREGIIWETLDLSWLKSYTGGYPIEVSVDALGSAVKEISPWVFTWSS